MLRNNSNSIDDTEDLLNSPQSCQNLPDSILTNFNFLSENLEEFSSELENSIRERCASSPLHLLVEKYLENNNQKGGS